MDQIPIILNPADIEFYVQSMKPSEIDMIGSKCWFDEHQRLERLRQQFLVGVNHNIEEKVKDVILNMEKLSVIIHEALCIQMWRQKVWKKIMKITEKKMLNGFVGYMIMYHECTAVNILQLLFHHKEASQSLGDEALDIIDYCAAQVVRILSSSGEFSSESKREDDEEEDEISRLKKHEKKMCLSTGVASIAILASLSEYIGELSVSAVVRIYSAHDVPLLMASLIEAQPWRRQSESGDCQCFSQGNWVAWNSEELCEAEAQCWIALRGLLLHPVARQHYEVSNHRRQTLLRLQKYLHEAIIDQLAPLLELKQLLGHLSVSSQTNACQSPLILETVAPITDALLCRGSKWKALLKKHIALMFDDDQQENAMEIAKSVSQTYDADFLSCLSKSGETPKIEKCALCGKLSTKKCSQCRSVYYCSRQCQVNDWNAHKAECITKN